MGEPARCGPPAAVLRHRAQTPAEQSAAPLWAEAAAYGTSGSRRTGEQCVIVLRHDHIEPCMNVQPELDHRAGESYVVTGDRECGRPFVMNDCLNHKAGESYSSPASFHVIYALQRTAPRVTVAAILRPGAFTSSHLSP